MKVSEFNNHIKTGDLARNNLYSVEIYLPQGHTGGGMGKVNFGEFYTGAETEGTGFLSFMTKSVTLPGKSIGTIEAKRFGPVYKVANDLIVDTVSMTFMCSADYKEHKFFEGWIAGIMGAVKPGTGATVSTNRQIYTLGYYYDYVGRVNIIPLDRQGGAAANIVLLEAYPTALGPIEMAWGDAGEVANFTVTWSFKDWNHTSVTGWNADPDSGTTGSEVKGYAGTEAPDRKALREHYTFGEGVVPAFRDAPGNTGDTGKYTQISADGTRIGRVPHETKRAPGKEGSGKYGPS